MLYSRLSASLLAHADDPQRFVLALSGGLDSRVLLHLMGQFIRQHPQHQCVAVHVHHGLSPHADSWSQHCQRWAGQEGIECYVEQVTLALGSRVSVEQQAREHRYQALGKHLNTGDILLTAQHADDQLETVLLTLKRGSGPAGLAAMPERTPFADGLHLRPLLTSTRQEIEHYGLQHQLEWVEDESNQDVRYDRNFLRHQVTPLLVERWPGIRKAVARSAALCGEQEALLQELLKDKLEQAVYVDQSLLISALGSERMGKQLIRQWLGLFDVLMPSQAQLEQIWRAVVLAKSDANPQLCWNNVQIRRYQQRLYLVRQWPDIKDWQQTCELDQTCLLPQGLGALTLRAASVGKGQLRLPRGDEVVSVRFDPEAIEAKPVGRVGKRKMKKLFQEYGVPSWNRRRTPLVFYGEQLAAVAGLFVVDAFSGQDCDLEWHNDVSDVQF
ncbi:tRNA lysidine(34) synthetase TilS [Photobacterium sp. SDRW27]|uniref:tRNA lysidine(34) synthetase TilS n=1 Tax=Photobacterium obscurum TaxID=2829490 RepID=UPI002242ED10|nr:tRNA lysidine(34) synthetase TilS [Photobacterium obscurum]MCW8331350.1 tRNA lysidine(34) synthetase TilS [Photobacterium obscurum]